MPVFELKIIGDDKPRLVQAKSGPVARAHLVTAKAVNADRMAELIGEGVKLETAGAAAERAAEDGDAGEKGSDDKGPGSNDGGGK